MVLVLWCCGGVAQVWLLCGSGCAMVWRCNAVAMKDLDCIRKARGRQKKGTSTSYPNQYKKRKNMKTCRNV